MPIHSLSVLCALLTRDLFAIAKLLFSYLTFKNITTLKSRYVEVTQSHQKWHHRFRDKVRYW